jgi:formylglycine-generating enzyme required for sulfatase activity
MPINRKLFLVATFVLAGIFSGIPALGQDAATALSVKEITNSIGMKLVLIPAGRFLMGSPASQEGSQEDETLHKVELTRSYYLQTTEVTERQWALVMEPAVLTEQVEERDPKTKRFIRKVEQQRPNPKLQSQKPIAYVSWDDAVEFCQKLSQVPEEKKESRFYRLPTEAEWEKACRADTNTAYFFGDDKSRLSSFAWFRKNSYEHYPQPPRKTFEVAKKAANPWGLFDMYGNVAEWCQDYYGPYPDGLVTDPIGSLHLRGERVIRGGQSEFDAEGCRSASRYRDPPDQKRKFVGFRVALSEFEIKK